MCGDAAEFVDPHDVDAIADGMERVPTVQPPRLTVIFNTYEIVYSRIHTAHKTGWRHLHGSVVTGYPGEGLTNIDNRWQ